MDPMTLLAVGGTVAGAIGGGGGEDQTSTTSMPSWMHQYVTGGKVFRDGKLVDTPGILPEAENLYADGPAKYYPGQTVAGFTGDQESAFDAYRYGAGQGIGNQSGSLAAQTLRGDFLGGDQFMNAYGNDIMDNVNAQFSGAGRSGSGYHAGAMAKELSGAASRLYDSERDRQQSTMANLSNINAGRYGDAQAMMNIGGMQQQQDQNMIGANMDEYNYNRNKGWDHLGKFSDFVYGAPHGSSTTTSGGGPSTMQNAMGGLSAGMQAASFGQDQGWWGK